MLSLNDGYASVKEEMKKNYDDGFNKNALRVEHFDKLNCTQKAEMHCFKYDNANKVFVFYLRSEECEEGFYTADKSYSYDLNNGDLTEVARPIEPLGMMEFYDGILLADLTQEDLKAFEMEKEYGYSFDVVGADLHEYYYWFGHECSLRSSGLAFDWNGHEFVRKPEADVDGLSVYEDGFCSMLPGSKIPEKIDGFTIEPVTYMAEGSEQIKYAIKKDGELIMEIHPTFDFNTLEFTDIVDEVNIFSEKYRNEHGFRVGSNINDVTAAYTDMYSVHYAMDESILVDIGGLQFVMDKNDFDGTLPEITSSEVAVIKNPTFKPDAKVKMLRLYNSYN